MLGLSVYGGWFAMDSWLGVLVGPLSVTLLCVFVRFSAATAASSRDSESGEREGDAEGELAQRSEGEGRGAGEPPGENPGEGEGESEGQSGEGQVAKEGQRGATGAWAG